MARLTLGLAALRSNLDAITGFCSGRGLEFLFVTKLMQSRTDVLAALDRPGLTRIADVHGANFRCHDPAVYPHRVVLRPRFGDIPQVAAYASRVFLADPTLARRLGAARQKLSPGVPLEVTLMVETGDLRDGVPWDDLPSVIRALASEPGLVIAGLGTNFGCLVGAIPDQDALGAMADGLNRVRRATGHPVPGFSIGGTVFWDLLRDHPVPPEFTELRLGEAAFFGWNTSLGGAVAGLSAEVFRLDLEVLEVWRKRVSALPVGPSGFNAFGEKPVQAHTGLRRRAVLDGGENLAPMRALVPVDLGCILVGETHEYTVIDCQNSQSPVVPGGWVGFRPGYEATARCFLAPHLELNLGETV
jgi:predicted amino acid racemase